MKNQITRLTAAGALSCEEVEVAAAPPDGWVRLRLARAGICGTDMHYFRHFGNVGVPLRHPVTLGHEASAFVVDSNGSGLSEGALVALNPIIPCHRCSFCRKGQENLCTDKRFPGSALTYPHIDGFFRSVIEFPAECCHPVPDGVPPEHLSFAEPLACALHAAALGEGGPGSRLLVMGCGPMGLLSIVAGLARGAEVDCCDMRGEAVAKGVEIGAQRGFEAGAETLPPDHYDCVIEASGSIEALNQAFTSVRKGGSVAILSNLQLGQVQPDLHRIMLKEIRMVGSFQFNREFAQAVAIIAERRFDFEAMIAARYPLQDVEKAFALAMSGKAVGKVQLFAA